MSFWWDLQIWPSNVQNDSYLHNRQRPFYLDESCSLLSTFSQWTDLQSNNGNVRMVDDTRTIIKEITQENDGVWECDGRWHFCKAVTKAEQVLQSITACYILNILMSTLVAWWPGWWIQDFPVPQETMPMSDTVTFREKCMKNNGLIWHTWLQWGYAPDNTGGGHS